MDNVVGRTVLPQTAAPAAGQLTDAELLGKVHRGDEKAFGQLVSSLFPAVYRAAARVLRQDTEAEDVAQEVFLKIWRDPPDLGEGGSLTAWSIRVATNGAIDRLRKRKPELADTLPDRVDPSLGAEGALQENQAAGSVQEAMELLPERQRLALVLTYYEGLANKEAAQILEVSVDALESLLSRARRSLKSMLADQWNDLLDDLAHGGAREGSWNTV